MNGFRVSKFGCSHLRNLLLRPSGLGFGVQGLGFRGGSDTHHRNEFRV